MIKLVSKISFPFVLLILLSFQGSLTQTQIRSTQINPLIKAQDVSNGVKVSLSYGKTPLYFIPNEGQVHERALFYAKTSRYTLWLTKEGLVFDSIKRQEKAKSESKIHNRRHRKNPEDFIYERDVSRLIFLNSNINPEVTPIDRTEHRINYFKGSDEEKWRTNIPTSKAVLYKELYRNIDLKVYGIEKQIEYDYIVRPGGEVSQIRFKYRNVKKTKIDEEDNLVIKTRSSELKHAKPVCYQVIGGERVDVEAQFRKIEDNTYGFKVKGYNKNYELIIDPLVLVYSTYLGGSGSGGDNGRGIAVDSESAVYVTGSTWSSNFPTYNPINSSNAGGSDVFITKLNATGDALVYSTYLGGSDCDYGYGIAMDSEGAAYVTGSTFSSDFPTVNPIYGTHAGGLFDVFITKINASGDALVYSTYLGGSDWDEGHGIAVDSEGAAYVTGYTRSDYFPTQNPIQGAHGGGYLDVFITKINASGDALVYSTYLGGSDYDHGYGIAVDSEGAAYVTGYTGSDYFPTQNPIQGSNAGGSDVFITKINATGDALVYSTYLGGSGWDGGYGIAVDSEGAAYVTGETSSSDFPTQNPIYGNYAGGRDAFITKINATGTALVYSTYLGGSGWWDGGHGIAVDSEGAAYVTGYTRSDYFPTQNPIQENRAGYVDVFITKINATGDALVYSTYLGGSGWDGGYGIAVDSEKVAYVTGCTESTDFPITSSAYDTSYNEGIDAFITKIQIKKKGAHRR